MRYTEEQKKIHYRKIYDLLWENFRITYKDMSIPLKLARNTVRNRLNEALEMEYLILPQIRRRSYFGEYVYIVRVKDTFETYMKFKNNKNIVYHAVLGGYANMWIISRGKIDIDGEILISGPRSDYHVAYAPYWSWNTSIYKMHTKLDEFNPYEYQPRNILQTHWGEILDFWDAEYEILFRNLKYNGRKKFTRILKKNLISRSKFYKFLDNLNKACIVFTRFFPKGMKAYDPYLFIFETDYEDFIIDLFSLLPTGSLFFKAANKLFVYCHVEKASIRETGAEIYDITQIQLLSLINDLKKKKFIKKEFHTTFESHWTKNL
ncbi:MAG: hypothetical protein PVF58_22555 [Candidatus Methanofastidiosia archaeon]|jgi:hypothetical protein